MSVNQNTPFEYTNLSVNIFSKLDLESLLNSSVVCKKWNKTIQEKEIQEFIYKNKLFQLTGNDFLYFKSNYTEEFKLRNQLRQNINLKIPFSVNTRWNLICLKEKIIPINRSFYIYTGNRLYNKNLREVKISTTNSLQNFKPYKISPEYLLLKSKEELSVFSNKENKILSVKKLDPSNKLLDCNDKYAIIQTPKNEIEYWDLRSDIKIKSFPFSIGNDPDGNPVSPKINKGFLFEKAIVFTTNHSVSKLFLETGLREDVIFNDDVQVKKCAVINENGIIVETNNEIKVIDIENNRNIRTYVLDENLKSWVFKNPFIVMNFDDKILLYDVINKKEHNFDIKNVANIKLTNNKLIAFSSKKISIYSLKDHSLLKTFDLPEIPDLIGISENFLCFSLMEMQLKLLKAVHLLDLNQLKICKVQINFDPNENVYWSGGVLYYQGESSELAESPFSSYDFYLDGDISKINGSDKPKKLSKSNTIKIKHNRKDSAKSFVNSEKYVMRTGENFIDVFDLKSKKTIISSKIDPLEKTALAASKFLVIGGRDKIACTNLDDKSEYIFNGKFLSNTNDAILYQTENNELHALNPLTQEESILPIQHEIIRSDTNQEHVLMLDGNRTLYVYENGKIKKVLEHREAIQGCKIIGTDYFVIQSKKSTFLELYDLKTGDLLKKLDGVSNFPIHFKHIQGTNSKLYAISEDLSPIEWDFSQDKVINIYNSSVVDSKPLIHLTNGKAVINLKELMVLNGNNQYNLAKEKHLIGSHRDIVCLRGKSKIKGKDILEFFDITNQPKKIAKKRISKNTDAITISNGALIRENKGILKYSSIETANKD